MLPRCRSLGCSSWHRKSRVSKRASSEWPERFTFGVAPCNAVSTPTPCRAGCDHSMYHKLQASNSFERRAVESAIAPVDAQEGAEQATSSPSSRPPPQPHSSQVAELNRQAFMLNAASNVDSSNLSESAINRWNSQTTTINQAPPHASPEALQSPLSPSFIISSDNDIHMLHSDHQDIAATPKSSLKSVWSTASMANSLSPAPSSAVSSPALAAMSDITPLPSPLLMGSSSPPSWRRSQTSRPGSQGDNPPLPKDQAMYAQTSINTSPTKKKAYGSLTPAALEASRAYNRNARAHSRNRSLSEYTPDTLYNTRPRHATLSESSQAQGHPSTATLLQRENYLAEVRGLATQAPQFQQPTLPTPPASNVSTTGSEGEEMKDEEAGTHVEVYTVRKHSDNKRQKTYRLVRLLGQGTFSKVILGTSDSQYLSSKAVPPESALSPKSLVAIKIVERGPAGGADEERVELGLHREVETLLSLNHPALVRIKTFDLDVSPALLVLDYCPGGDLYELATQASDPLLQGVVRRIFAELVSAVRYLHSEWIAHRDIKLESMCAVLFSLPYIPMRPSN